MLGSTSNHDILIQARTAGLTQAQAQVGALYSQAQLNVRGLSDDMQRFGHHSFTALAIFKGLAIYRGFGYLTQSIGEGAQAAIDFQHQMAMVNSQLLLSQEQLQIYSDALIDFSKTMPLTLQQLAEGMYDIVSAGYSGSQSMFILNKASIAAVAGATDLKSASQAGIATMNAFGKSLTDLDHIYDVHFEAVKMGIFTYEQLNQVLGRVVAAASLAGQTMETAFSALVAVSRAGFGGVAFSEGATRVVRFFQELTDASVQQKIQALGIATEDSFGKMRNAIDIVADLQAKLATMTDSARSALTNQLFTNERSIQGFQTLAKMVDTWREAEMKGIFSVNAADDAFKKMQDTVKNTLVIIQNQFTASMTRITSNLTPALSGISTAFESISQAMLPFIITIGLIVAKYAEVYMWSRHLENQKMAEARSTALLNAEIGIEYLRRGLLQRQVELEIAVKQKLKLVMTELQTAQYGNATLTNAQTVALEKEAQARIANIITLHQEFASLSNADKAKYANIYTEYKAIFAKQDLVDKTYAEITATDQLIQRLQNERNAHVANSFSKIAGAATGMILVGSMLAMASGSRELTAAMLAMQTLIMTFQVILPVVAMLFGTTTAALISMAASAYATGGAIGVLRAMLGDVTVVVSLATAVAVAAGIAYLTLNSSIGKVTTTAHDYTDAIDQMEQENQTLEESTTTLIEKLVNEGQTLGFITQQVKNLAEASHDIGPGMIQGLAKQHFAMVGNTAIVAPSFAKTEGANKALASIGVSPDSKQAILQAQKILKDFVTSADASLSTIGKTLTREIFGGFGDSLITLWGEYGKELTVVDAKHKILFDKANQYAADYTANTRKQYEDQLAAMSPQQLASTLNIGPEGYRKGEYVGLEAAKEAWVNAALDANETYQEAMSLMGEWYSIGDIWKGAGYNMVDIMATMGQVVEDSMKGLSDVMALDDVVQAMIDHSGALEDAGIHWEGVADNWDKLGKDWAIIQQKWQALQLIETFMNVTKSLSDIPTQIISSQAVSAQEILAGPTGKFLESMHGKGVAMLDNLYSRLLAQASQTTTLIDPDALAKLQQDIYAGIYPTLVKLLPQLLLGEGGTTGLMDIILNIFNSGNIWEIISEVEGDVEKTMDEIVSDWMDMLHGASGFSSAIEEFVNSSSTLEEAGYFFRQVAGGWDQLGTEWARIQAQFKVIEMINSFRTAAASMTEMGVTLPEGFQDSMFQLMQLLASSVLPDFQSIIDGLLDNIGSADFWDALAKGMSEADIKQNNSIVLAPYIVVSEGMDNEAIVDLIHETLVDEATRNGFTWGG